MDATISKRIVFLGFVMTCFIVLYHAGQIDSSQAVTAIDSKLNDAIGFIMDKLAVLAMSWFFSVTGFLLFRDLTYGNYSQKMKRRFFSLFVPYILWETITMIKLAIQASPTLDTVVQWLSRIFLFSGFPPDGALWYMYAVFVIGLLSPAILFVVSRKHGLTLTVLLIIALVAIRHNIGGFFTNVLSYGYLSNVISYMPCYICGSYVGYLSNDARQLSNCLRLVVAIVATVIALEWFWAGVTFDTSLRLLPVGLLYSFPVRNALLSKWLFKHSFLIYAIHQPLIFDIRPIVRKAINGIIPYVSLTNVCSRIVLLIIIVAAAVLLYAILNKVWPKALSLLTGNRTAVHSDAGASVA